jgi:hypothetical protein
MTLLVFTRLVRPLALALRLSSGDRQLLASQRDLSSMTGYRRLLLLAGLDIAEARGEQILRYSVAKRG